MDTLASDQPVQVQPHIDWVGVSLFVVLTIAIGLAIDPGYRAFGQHAAMKVTKESKNAAMLGGFAPAFVCVLLRLVRREGFADSGLKLAWRGRGWRMYLAAYLIVPILALLGMGLALATGTQHWDPNHGIRVLMQDWARYTASHSSSFQASPEQYTWAYVYQPLIFGFTIFLPIMCVFAFGAELGWRGYLLPRLAPLGETSAAALTGALVGLCSIPVWLFSGAGGPIEHRLLDSMLIIVRFTISGFFMAWLRFRSGSIGPGLVASAVANQAQFLPFYLLSTGNWLLSPPRGLMGVLPIALFAAWLWRTGRLRPGRPDAVVEPVAGARP